MSNKHFLKIKRFDTSSYLLNGILLKLKSLTWENAIDKLSEICELIPKQEAYIANLELALSRERNKLSMLKELKHELEICEKRKARNQYVYKVNEPDTYLVCDGETAEILVESGVYSYEPTKVSIVDYNVNLAEPVYAPYTLMTNRANEIVGVI